MLQFELNFIKIYFKVDIIKRMGYDGVLFTSLLLKVCKTNEQQEILIKFLCFAFTLVKEHKWYNKDVILLLCA